MRPKNMTSYPFLHEYFSVGTRRVPLLNFQVLQIFCDFFLPIFSGGIIFWSLGGFELSLVAKMEKVQSQSLINAVISVWRCVFFFLRSRVNSPEPYQMCVRQSRYFDHRFMPAHCQIVLCTMHSHLVFPDPWKTDHDYQPKFSLVFFFNKECC